MIGFRANAAGIRSKTVATVAVIFLIGLCQSMRAQTVTRGYFVGTIGKSIRIQMDIEVDSSLNIVGKYFYENVGIPLFLHGHAKDDSINIEESDAQNHPTGHFQGRIDSAGKILAGDWRSLTGRKMLPFTMTKVADYRVLRSRDNKIETTVTYPHFLAASSSLQHLNRDLADSAKINQEQFVAEGLASYAVDSLALVYGYEMNYDCSVAAYTGDFVSLLTEISTYTGGAHGNVTYATDSFSIKSDKPVPLTLEALFAPDTPYLDVLSARCIAELRKQDAAWVVSGEIARFDAEQLRKFTLSARAITFIFAPYEVGAYAEGTHSVTIPLPDLARFLNAAGPFARFLHR